MKEEKCLKILKELALLGAIEKEIAVTSHQLSELMNSSQQSASRYLIEMERAGYLERKLGVKKQRVKITEKGRKVLEKEYFDYKKIFSKKKEMVLKGVVTSGLGEGKYYTCINGYVRQFVEKLGFRPAPGTLNVRILNEYTDRFRELENIEGIEIRGFSTKDRSFGGAKCFFVKIKGLDAAAIIPSRSHHSDILEIIAPYKLREKLNLKDGDTIEIKVILRKGKYEK